MIQLYPLSLFIMFFSALFSFLEVYKAELSFLLRFKRALEKNERIKNIFFIVFLLTFVLMLFFPISPGPVILGDFLPSFAVFYSALILKVKKEDIKDDVVTDDVFKSKYFKKGVFFSASFVLHFVFPSFIIL